MLIAAPVFAFTASAAAPLGSESDAVLCAVPDSLSNDSTVILPVNPDTDATDSTK